MIYRKQSRSAVYKAGVTVLLAASTLSVVFAQSVPASADRKIDSEPKLEEVVITAERRQQRLQDVPISATVLTGEELVKKGVANINDLQDVAPGVAINTNNRSTFVNIRGVGMSTQLPAGSPGVAYYIDGLLLPNEQFIGMSFFDIGSIEVLRGPQGTLTGQNSTGGAIFVRTPEPKFGVRTGYIDQVFGNYGHYRTTGAINLGLSDDTALRIAALHDTTKSFTTNIGPSGSQPGSGTLDAMRMNLAIRGLGGRLKANIRAEGFINDTDNIALKNPADKVTANPFIIEEDAPAFLLQRGYRVSGDIKYDLSDSLQVRGLTAWQSGYTKEQLDGDRTATALPQPPTANTGRVSHIQTVHKDWINEINLISTGSETLKWVAGAFTLDSFTPVNSTLDNFHTTQYLTNTRIITTDMTSQSRSLFGQANWFATEKMELVGGLRYSRDSQFNDRRLPGPLPTPPVTTTSYQATSAVTGKAGATFHYSPDAMLYATASRGYKMGGSNLSPYGVPGFQPEYNTVYEIGSKETFLNKRLRLNISAFYGDYKDIQLSTLVNGISLVQNAAAGTTKGAEAELTGRFGGLGLNVGVGYLVGQFAKDVYLVNAINNASTLVHSGDTLPYSPKWTANAGVQYEFLLANDWMLTPRLQWNHVDQLLVSPFSSSATIVPGRDLFDARLTLDSEHDYTFEGFVSNLTNKTYLTMQVPNSSSVNGGLMYGAPRQFGVRFQARF